MNTLLVVEDEKLIRQGIVAMIRRSSVPVEEILEQFARFLLPKIQAFYETEEGQRAFQEWKKRNKN